MGCCFVPDCSHRTESSNCQFSRFPTDKKKLKKWINLIRRGDKEPIKTTQVCSCHFKNGNFGNLPTIFARNASKTFSFSSPEKTKPRGCKRAAIHPESLAKRLQSEEVNEATAKSLLQSEMEIENLSTPTPSFYLNANSSINEIETESVLNTRVELIVPTPLPSTDLNANNSIHEIEAESEADMSVEVIIETESEVDISVQTDSNATNPINLIEATSEADISLEIVPLSSVAHAVTQTPYEFPPIVYEAEIDILQKEIDALKIECERLKMHPFGFFSIKNDDTACAYYTGIKLDIFSILVKVSRPVCDELPTYDGKKIELLHFTDQMLLVLMKLRLNLDFFDLAKRFGVSRTTAYRIFRTVLPALHIVVFQAFMDEIPSRAKIQQSMPSCFDSFPNCTLIVDSTEMRCESPSNLAEQKASYSSYKHFPSVKVTIGILPNGTAIACTSCYPGSISDKAIIKHSKFFKCLRAGDLVLADKGFTCYEDLPPGVSLNIPPFLTNGQFTPSEVWETRSIAKARIHIERFNARFKNYRITRLIPYTTFKYVSTIVQTCVGLINFKNSLLKEVE